MRWRRLLHDPWRLQRRLCRQRRVPPAASLRCACSSPGRRYRSRLPRPGRPSAPGRLPETSESGALDATRSAWGGEQAKSPAKTTHLTLSLSPLIHFPQAPGARSVRLVTRIRARRGRAVRACGPVGRRGDAGGTGLAFLSDREAEGDEGGDGEGLSLSSPAGRRGPGRGGGAVQTG